MARGSLDSALSRAGNVFFWHAPDSLDPRAIVCSSACSGLNADATLQPSLARPGLTRFQSDRLLLGVKRTQC